MLHIKRPKAKASQETILKREQGFLSEKEIRQYLENIDDYHCLHKSDYNLWDYRDKAIIYMFLTTGVRNSALRMLDLEDIDLKHKTMVVTDKGDKVRTYELSDKLYDALETWFKIRETIIECYIDDKEQEDISIDTNALFISNKMRRMSIGAVNNWVKKYAFIVNGKNITPHKLRATYGTQLYNKTGDIYFVQQCMGHNNPKTTELYIREKKKETKKASDIMNKLL